MKSSRLSSILFLLLLFFSSCSWRPTSQAYQESYAHLNTPKKQYSTMQESDYYIVFLVDARHFDYTSLQSAAKTLTKQPDKGVKDSQVGHAWIYLHGLQKGKPVVIEGGHSGEFGITCPRYADGLQNYILYGYSQPTPEQMRSPRTEPNPVKYLWATLNDGSFEEGSGNHIPTYAAKIDLTEEQFHKVVAFIDPHNYYYPDYALTHNQCSSFVAQIAAIVDFPLEDKVTVRVDPHLKINFKEVLLWTDPKYSQLTFSTPDVLERSLMQAVQQNRAQYALTWYLKTHSNLNPPPPPSLSLSERLNRLFLYYSL